MSCLLIKIGVDINQLKGTHGPSNRWKHRQMEEAGAELVPLRLPFGDYILINDRVQELIDRLGGPDNVHKADLLSLIGVSVDTKKNLSELCQNVCQGHERFRKELLKPLSQSEAKLVILVEEDLDSLEDVYFWDNPSKHPRAVKGSSLYKSLCTIRDEYNVDIRFCSRAETGKQVIEILTKGESHGEES